MDKTKLNLECLRAYDAEWDENKHPRADNGQFTSGGGSAGSSSGGSSSASSTKKYNQKDLLKLANNHLNYHLGYNETDATADKVEIVSEPDEHGNVDAKVSYDVTVRIPYQETDWDGYTHTTYEEDSEYRTDIIPLNISDLKPEESEAPKSPLRQAAAIVQGTSNTGFNFSPRKKQLTMNILQRDIDNFGSSSPIGKVNTSLLNDLKNGKSFTEAINNAKAKYKGKGDEYDSQLYDFYVTSKGPQGNENFVKEYGSKGSDYRSQKKALEREAEAWLES